MDKTDKIRSLQKHIEKVKAQSMNPNSKYKEGKLESYKEWAKLEIKRTEAKIKYLKGDAT